MKTHQWLMFAIVGLNLLLVGCGSAEKGDITRLPVPSSTVAEEATPIPPPTVEPPPAAALMHTPDSPSATSMVIPTKKVPDAPLSEEGPWLVFLATDQQYGMQYLWAINPDGSGLTRLVEEPVISFQVRPYSTIAGGTTIAYITGAVWQVSEQPDYVLKLLSLPSGEARDIVPLFNTSLVLEGADFNLRGALEYGSALTWSPDGSALAFVGMLNDTSVDAYTYNYAEGGVNRLTDLPTHSYDLRWSPDGDYLLHREFESMGMRGPETFGGYWAVKADGSSTQQLAELGYESSYGWLSSTEIILERFDWTQDASITEIYAANIETGGSSVILQDSFSRAAFAPEHNVWLLAQLRAYYDEDEKANTSLIMYRYGDKTEIPDPGIIDVFWSSEDDTFLGWSLDGILYQISTTGEVTETAIQLETAISELGATRIISPDGRWWAWYSHHPYETSFGLWGGEPMANPALLLASGYLGDDDTYVEGPLITDITWAPDSQRLIVLSINHGLLTLEPPDFEPVCIEPDLYALSTRHDWKAAWVP